jgi:hypothetical protein
MLTTLGPIRRGVILIGTADDRASARKAEKNERQIDEARFNPIQRWNPQKDLHEAARYQFV